MCLLILLFYHITPEWRIFLPVVYLHLKKKYIFFSNWTKPLLKHKIFHTPIFCSLRFSNFRDDINQLVKDNMSSYLLLLCANCIQQYIFCILTSLNYMYSFQNLYRIYSRFQTNISFSVILYIYQVSFFEYYKVELKLHLAYLQFFSHLNSSTKS